MLFCYMSNVKYRQSKQTLSFGWHIVWKCYSLSVTESDVFPLLLPASRKFDCGTSRIDWLGFQPRTYNNCCKSFNHTSRAVTTVATLIYKTVQSKCLIFPSDHMHMFTIFKLIPKLDLKKHNQACPVKLSSTITSALCLFKRKKNTCLKPASIKNLT